MKRILVITALLTCTLAAHSQDGVESWYDFWVGKWNASWDNGDGTKGEGSNHIFKRLNEKVLEENFTGAGGFEGMSISVYNPRTQTWHQAWADNQGGYFNFVGKKEGDKRYFSTIPVEKDGKVIIQRMVFYDIQEDSFTWDWENTNDGGKTWNLAWRINYTRAE